MHMLYKCKIAISFFKIILIRVILNYKPHNDIFLSFDSLKVNANVRSFRFSMPFKAQLHNCHIYFCKYDFYFFYKVHISCSALRMSMMKLSTGHYDNLAYLK